MAFLDDMEKNSPFQVDEFNKVLDANFSVFKNGDKYDFVRDMKDAFAGGIKKTAAEKIFDTIPDHVFWDIKVPKNMGISQQYYMNPYNSFRKYPVESFFDAQATEEYMDRRTKKNNLRDGVSTYRRY